MDRIEVPVGDGPSIASNRSAAVAQQIVLARKRCGRPAWRCRAGRWKCRGDALNERVAHRRRDDERSRLPDNRRASTGDSRDASPPERSARRAASPLLPACQGARKMTAIPLGLMNRRADTLEASCELPTVRASALGAAGARQPREECQAHACTAAACSDARGKAPLYSAIHCSRTFAQVYLQGVMSGFGEAARAESGFSSRLQHMAGKCLRVVTGREQTVRAVP